MSRKGKAGAFISGFMGSYNAERDRTERKQAADHAKQMDASLKQFREVQIASERARLAAAKDDELQEKATVEGIMQADKAKGGTLYDPFLKEETVPDEEAGFMGGTETRRVSEAPSLEGVRYMGESRRADVEGAALAESRKVTGEAATTNAATRKLEAENKASQLAEVKRMDMASREAIRGTLATEFAGLYQKITDSGLNFDNLDGASARMIGEYMVQSANDVEDDLDKMQSRLDGYDTLLMNLHLKNQATAAKAVGGLSPEAKQMMDVNTLTITEKINSARGILTQRMEAVREQARFNREGPVVPPEQVPPNDWNHPAPEEGFYNENPYQAQQPYAQTNGIMGPNPTVDLENPSGN